ncbi:DUF6933 domain-containing protein [Sandarakinorhabdus cyanobacteriorum]|uniref:DUF6933 domain-containing protein n=1 Tax=Sandarakinorhabdus cyanobacteriorum TaxID=1981098 RepID=UPI000D08EC0B
MFHLHCTKKLFDRIKPGIVAPEASDTALGNWYATIILWKPQLALLVSERALLPVLMPLAPATTLARRFPAQLALVLKEHGVNRRSIGTPYRRAKGTPLRLCGSVDAGRVFRAAGGVGRA